MSEIMKILMLLLAKLHIDVILMLITDQNKLGGYVACRAAECTNESILMKNHKTSLSCFFGSV